MQGTMPGALCTQARKVKRGLDGQHHDVDRTLRGRVDQNDRGHYIDRESTSMVWPTLRTNWSGRTLVAACRRRCLQAAEAGTAAEIVLGMV